MNPEKSPPPDPQPDADAPVKRCHICRNAMQNDPVQYEVELTQWAPVCAQCFPSLEVAFGYGRREIFPDGSSQTTWH